MRLFNVALSDKAEATKELALTGAAIGSLLGPTGAAIGGGIGGLTGLIVGDNTTVFPIDMVAIPAYQAYLMQGAPQFTVYIKAGETLVPTGGNVLDMTENMDIEAAGEMSSPKKRKRGAGLPKKFAKMGFSKGWKAYKKTPAYKKKQASKKKKPRSKRGKK